MQPTIDAERCVHSLTPQASCQRCVDACPHGALLLGEEALRMDSEACDGCGLCVPACTEEAIEGHAPIAARWEGNPRIAAFACSRSGVTPDVGVIRCLHALGMRDLLALYKEGIRKLAFAAADCDRCEYGCSERIELRVSELFLLFRVNGIAELYMRYVTLARWQSCRESSAIEEQPANASRRRFFRGVANSAVERARAPGEDTAQPLGKWMYQQGTVALAPFVPQIEASRCDACGACVQLCPHDAITTLGPEKGLYRLQIDCLACTGCDICQDICISRAITVRRSAVVQQKVLSFHERKCQRCGANFFVPDSDAAVRRVCSICAVNSSKPKLYQVFP